MNRENFIDTNGTQKSRKTELFVTCSVTDKKFQGERDNGLHRLKIYRK